MPRAKMTMPACHFRNLVSGACGLAILALGTPAHAGNPIIPNKGINDPHIHIFGDTAYLYASHDKSPDNKTFIMEDWTVWKSKDLVKWELASVLKPEQTYIGPGFKSAWATDAAEKNGKYYLYFSEANKQTGVVVGDTPTGPWRDILKKPLLTSEMTPTHEYDPGVFAEGRDRYIVFGVFDYFIAKLGEDMVSLAEKPRSIEIANARGPYTDHKEGPFAGKLTDDKPFLHKYRDRYYLSWGAFYAVADNVYGPYRYAGRILEEASFAPGYKEPTWPVGWWQGRHGSFFEWHGQTYFAYCDISQTGNRYFRDTFISYVHYRADGTIAPIRVDGIGVGEYDVAAGPIEAENFFYRSGLEKVEDSSASGGFVMRTTYPTSTLRYPNIRGLTGKQTAIMAMQSDTSAKVTVTLKSIRTGLDASGRVIARGEVDLSANVAQSLQLALPKGSNIKGLELEVETAGGNVTIDRLYFD